MIDVYFWPTPNGQKVTIALEELGLPYNVIPINIGKGDQFKSEFLKISPNNKMPAIVDAEGPSGKPISIFESGAILIYLAEKTGRLMPTDARGRYRVLEWLMFQMGASGQCSARRIISVAMRQNRSDTPSSVIQTKPGAFMA